MPKNLYNSKDVLSVDDNCILTVSFPNKAPFTINLVQEDCDDELIDKIRHNQYCGGCQKLSSKGYNGSKRAWCEFSRMIANYTNN